jgi:hypothetical protein
MTTVGVKELRQNASEILREVEAGKWATVTVALMLCVLDTSILISEHPARIEGEIAISTVSIAALQFGVLVTPGDDQRTQSGPHDCCHGTCPRQGGTCRRQIVKP